MAVGVIFWWRHQAVAGRPRCGWPFFLTMGGGPLPCWWLFVEKEGKGRRKEEEEEEALSWCMCSQRLYLSMAAGEEEKGMSFNDHLHSLKLISSMTKKREKKLIRSIYILYNNNKMIKRNNKNNKIIKINK